MAELEIKRSRFLASLDPVGSRDEALSVVSKIRRQYPDARHHCWAYVIGSPMETSSTACSDDGEPQGTAGNPMLNVLQQQGVGDCVVVVARYFGGTRLGTGGLARAYSGALQMVLESCTLRAFEARVTLEISCAYHNESGIRLIVAKMQGTVENVRYQENTSLAVSVASLSHSELVQMIQDECRGRAEIKIMK